MCGPSGVTVGALRRYESKVYEAETAGVTGTIPPIHSSGSEWDGSGGKDINAKPSVTSGYGIKWKYKYDRYGIVKISGFVSATAVVATVIRRLPDSLVTVPSFRWAHGAFSTAKGWPNLVVNWAGRQLHIKDFDIHGSVAGDYLNYATLTTSGLLSGDLAFRRTLATEDPALWVAGDRKLIVGTASREIAVGAINSAAAISGDNIAAEPQTFYGSEKVFPIQIGMSTIFVQRGGRKLREAGYEFSRDRYLANNMTVWCRHITKPGIIQFAYQKEDEELMLGVRADGQMIAHPHAPEQEIKGFTRIKLGGSARVLSAVSVVGANGKSDEVWALIAFNGGKYICRQAAWRDEVDAIEESFFVDLGVRVDAIAGQTHFSGATHLAGQAVAVLAAGGVVPGIVVDDTGAFDLPASAVPNVPYVMIVGLPYTATAILLPSQGRIAGNQSTQGLRQRITKIALRLLQTGGARVGQLNNPIDEIIDRPASANMDAPVPLFTGDTGDGGGIVESDFDRSAQGVFISDTPLPYIVTTAMLNIEVDQQDV